MRKWAFMCLLTMLVAFAGPGWAAVTINAANFPDANFRAYVLDELDTDDSGSLSNAEIAEAKTIDVSGKAITSLQGISFFSGLRRLYCHNNGLETLDVSACKELRILYCNNNVLTDLDVSGCTKLATLHCYNNLLTELDVGDCTNLQILSCHNNLINNLDVSKCMALTSLRCYSNKITALDVTKCGNLETLYCYSNLLTTLDLSKCPKLTVTGFNIEFGQVIPDMADAGPSGNAVYPYQIDLNAYTTISHVIPSSVKGYSGESVIETQYDEGTGIALFKTQPTGVQYNYDTGFTGADPASASPIYMDVTLTKGMVINIAELPYGYVGVSYNFYLTAAGTLITAPTWNATPLPGGLDVYSSIGKIHGKPTIAGDYNVTITAQSGALTAHKTLPLKIKPASEAPTRPTITTTSSSLPTATKGVSYTATLTATGTAPIKWSLYSGELPHNLTLSENGVISGTPDTVGKSTFRVSAANDVGERTQSLTINVSLLGSVTKPEITTTTADLPTGKVGTPYNAILEASGTTPITWEWTGGNLPDGLKISESGIISGTPQTVGASNFTVKAINEAGFDKKALRISISAQGGGDDSDPGDGSGGGGGGCSTGFGVFGLALGVAVFFKKSFHRG